MPGMIYSRYRPDVGGYEYFRAAESYNRNDDLPTPELPPASKIGVPSIEAGRPIPPNAVKVGEGEVAVGLLAPVDESRVVRRTRSLAGVDMPQGATKWVAGAVIGVAVIWLVARKR